MADPERSLAVLRRLVQDDLERRGRAGAGFAAAVLAARGRLGLDPDSFGRRLGIPGWAVVLLERGHTGPSGAPPALADVAPDIDWTSLGLPGPGEPPGRPGRPRPGRAPRHAVAVLGLVDGRLSRIPPYPPPPRLGAGSWELGAAAAARCDRPGPAPAP